MTVQLYDDGTGAKPLFVDTGGGVMRIAKADTCCCGCASCGGMPTTIYGVLSRDAGDWSGCGAGKWDDGEQFTLTRSGGTPGSSCEGGDNVWTGTLACGDTIEICCDDTGGFTITMWWCVSAYETQLEVECEDGQFAVQVGDIVIDDICCCDENTNPVTFTITFYMNPP